MSLPDRVVAMFAKAPVPGRVKTRLAADLSDDEAARLHRAFLQDLGAMLAGLDDVHPVLAYAGDRHHEAFEPLRDAGFGFVDQGGGDLGRRLTTVHRDLFDRGAEKVVVIGSDSPTLLPTHVEDAMDRLDRARVVIGPSFDGGYYLMGVTRQTFGTTEGDVHPIFDEIDWSTRRVLGQTLRRVHDLGLLSDLLGFWYDVDTLEDLQILNVHLREFLCHHGVDVAPETQAALQILEVGGRL